MSKHEGETRAVHEMAFEAFGVRVAVATTTEGQLARVQELLPPGWVPLNGNQADVDKRFTIELDTLEHWILKRDGKPVTRAGLGPNHVIMLLESQIRAFVALNAPNFVFVHAGVVAINDELVVMPGYSFSGKSTLVTAFVEAGATYYSDEYAPIDAEGLVHPYARQISMRRTGRVREDSPVAQIGGVAGDQPLPISRVVVTSYSPQAEWDPQPLSPGAAAMALLSHTVPAQSRPEQSMRHLTAAVKNAAAVESKRGEAAELASTLIRQLSD